jgi:hypothetical protein
LQRAGFAVAKRPPGTVSTQSLWFHPGPLVVARLLSAEPFAYEVLQAESLASEASRPDEYLRRSEQFDANELRVGRSVAAEDLEALSRLQPGQLFEAHEGVEFFGMSSVLATYEIRPLIPGTPVQSRSLLPSFNQSGLEFRLRGSCRTLDGDRGSTEFRLYSDGGVSWVDHCRRVVLLNHRISKARFRQLMGLVERFASGHENVLSEAEPRASAGYDALLVVCPELFEIPLSRYAAELEGVKEAADAVVSDALRNTELILTYRRKDQIHVRPWPLADLPPMAVMHLQSRRREENARHRGLAWPPESAAIRRWLESHPTLQAELEEIRELPLERLDTPLSESMGQVVQSAYSDDPDDPKLLNFFRYGDQLLRVRLNKCIQWPHIKSQCFNDTLGALSIVEVYDALEPQGAYAPESKRILSLWPRAAALRLESVPAEGTVVPADEYHRNRIFYEHLVERSDFWEQFIDGDYLLRDVHVQTREVPAQARTGNPVIP